MSIQVLFFGATAAVTGKRQIEVEATNEAKAQEIFNQMLVDYPKLAAHRLLFSVNQRYARGDEIIRDGDELAVFTAVSGG